MKSIVLHSRFQYLHHHILFFHPRHSHYFICHFLRSYSCLKCPSQFLAIISALFSSTPLHYFFRWRYNPANLSRLPFWMRILASSFSFYSLYWDAMEIWSTWNLGSPYFGGGGGDTSSPTMAWATRLSRRINWFDNFWRSFIRSKKSMQIFFCIGVKWPCLSCWSVVALESLTILAASWSLSLINWRRPVPKSKRTHSVLPENDNVFKFYESLNDNPNPLVDGVVFWSSLIVICLHSWGHHSDARMFFGMVKTPQQMFVFCFLWDCLMLVHHLPCLGHDNGKTTKESGHVVLLLFKCPPGAFCWFCCCNVKALWVCQWRCSQCGQWSHHVHHL